MERTYALCDDTGLCVNAAICDDPAWAANQGWLDITNLNPQPWIGWTWDGTSWIAPPDPTPSQ